MKTAMNVLHDDGLLGEEGPVHGVRIDLNLRLLDPEEVIVLLVGDESNPVHLLGYKQEADSSVDGHDVVVASHLPHANQMRTRILRWHHPFSEATVNGPRVRDGWLRHPFDLDRFPLVLATEVGSILVVNVQGVPAVYDRLQQSLPDPRNKGRAFPPKSWAESGNFWLHGYIALHRVDLIEHGLNRDPSAGVVRFDFSHSSLRLVCLHLVLASDPLVAVVDVELDSREPYQFPCDRHVSA